MIDKWLELGEEFFEESLKWDGEKNWSSDDRDAMCSFMALNAVKHYQNGMKFASLGDREKSINMIMAGDSMLKLTEDFCGTSRLLRVSKVFGSFATKDIINKAGKS